MLDRPPPSALAAVLLTCWTGPLASSALAQNSVGLVSAEDSRPDGTQMDVAETDGVEDAFIALEIRDRLSPYERVRYEVKTRGHTLIVSLSKRLAHGYGDLEDVGLMPLDELTELVHDLRGCGLEQLAESRRPAPSDAVTYELEVRLGDYQLAERWAADSSHPGSPHWCVAQTIFDAYAAVSDPIPFQNLFWDEGEYGELNTASVPPARLFVDDRDTGLMTPIYGLRLEPGIHMVRYVNDSLDIDRDYDVTIVEGHTTQLEVELR